MEKSIEDLQEYNFFINSYQRPYKWEDSQVKDLLEDIKNSEKYFLQQIVVKRNNIKDVELIDGQQRITTIFLILQELDEKNFFKIESKENNISNYYKNQAIKTIQDFFKNNDKVEFKEKLLKKTFILEYETNDVNIFEKINNNKIDFTEADLIKAILFKNENFENENYITKKELVIQWELLSRELQNDSFWYFLVNEDYKNRFDLIFEMFYENKGIVKNDINYPIFNYIKNEINKSGNEAVYNIWQDILKIRSKLMIFYNDMYDIVGYIIASNIKNIKDICKNNIYKKEDFKNIIKEHFTKNNIEKYIKNLYYKDKKVKDMLLLFNVLNGVDFCNYKKYWWDIEHIHATKDNSQESDDNISNLCLLDESTNRSYQDKNFKEKRKVIIDKIKNNEFVLPCTKNVFLNIYNIFKDDNKSSYNKEKWDDEDKENYLEEMIRVIKDFWEE